MRGNIRLSLIAFLMILGACISAQEDIASLEKSIEGLWGVEKLKGYHTLIEHYVVVQPKKASRYVRRAEDLTESVIHPGNKLLNTEDFELKPKTYLLAARFYETRGFYMESKTAFQKALLEYEALDNMQMRDVAQRGVERLDSLSYYTGGGKKRFLGGALSDLSSAIDKGTDDMSIKSTLNRAKNLEEEGDLEGALTNYRALVNYYSDKGDWSNVSVMQDKVDELSETLSASVASTESEPVSASISPTASDSSRDSVDIATLQSEPNSGLSLVREGRGGPNVPEIVNTDLTPYRDEANDIKNIAEKAENDADYERSLFYFKEYMALEKRLAEQELNKELALQEQEYRIEARDREILLLKQNEEIYNLELERQESSQKQMTVGLILLGIVAGSIVWLYYTKRRDHAKLSQAYDDLETAQGQLKGAQAHIKQLLGQQISGAVAEALITDESASQVARRFVCIMFLDIRNFTGFAEKLLPEEIINYQNKVFGFMIDAINRHHGIVNQILGDGFMATFGAPVSKGNDCMNAYAAAREIMEGVNAKSESGEIPKTRVGIGLHAGHVVTGNVGTEQRKQYSITGNTVIIAARLEQLNKELGSTLVISREVYDQLPLDMREPVEFEQVMVKGRSLPVEIAAFERA